MLNLAQIAQIDRQTLWLEITAADLQIAEPSPQLYSNRTGLNYARSNRLCLHKFGTWLTESGIDYTSSLSELEMYPLWDVVNGCAIEIGKTRLILIPTDTLDRDEIRVPQEWVDLPNLQGDYYLAVQIDFDTSGMNIWGFTSHRTLKQQGEYTARDRTYSLPSERLVANLDILWMAQELDLNEVVATPELPDLSLDRALELIKQLSTPSPYSPRTKVEFFQWGSILNNPNLRTQLYHIRLQQAVLAHAPAPSFSLSNWLQSKFSNAIASGWKNYYQPAIVKGNHTVDRSKLINLQLELQRLTVVLLVGIVAQPDGEVRVVVQIHPGSGERIIPPQLQLSYLDENGSALRMVVARTNDDYIQLPSFTCSIGTKFSIQIQLNSCLTIERFVV
ncbi:DUF1822 family protein [Chamaesiphon sp. OTE_20_metabat_361]|uniref:DUF1822 family protein n=1 Tax=Chamaesiphon sp. OTE_20_metabat_361 TaxID=2964689 RepID=UPI00286B1573|nr:DUF1822 family protein [Chamaesiphon sp. OTE_20_metabat_361]